MQRIVVIGGGPAGIISAISCAKQSNEKVEITIIEKNPVLGKKILVSGNGRCNLTNSNLDILKYHCNRNFIKAIFARFNNNDLINYFDGIGVKLREEEYGRMFPYTNQSSTILDVLTEELGLWNVNIKCNEDVVQIDKPKEKFIIITSKSKYEADKILLAVGGCSYPQLGSTKKGFDLAMSFGHSILGPHPALVPIELNGNWFHKLQGVKSNVRIIINNDSFQDKYEGEMLFTHYGISGPVVLDASSRIIELYKNPKTEIYINFLPEFNCETLENYLNDLWKNMPKRNLVNSFLGVFPKKLAFVILTQILPEELNRNVCEISKKQQRKIIEKLLKFHIEVKNSRPFTESMVTAGGVSTDEIDPQTMESKLVKNLFFAGEIIDVDAESGGYNLQFAFSTGWIAGLNAGRN